MAALNLSTIHKMHSKANGFGAIGMVILLSILGGLLVSGLSYYLLSWQKAAIYQKQYYHHYNQSLSAIYWSLSQTWNNVTNQWQCKNEPSLQLQACIKLSTLNTGQFAMIKGQSEQFTLYHLATYQNNAGSVKLTIQTGHWLDYCPENRSLDCD